MADVIKLLPDSIANQIAAGEVIQRPASVVKELLENAIDAGATEIKLIIKDSGKTLIQVIDNGKGMSDLDARMCFERHATSKISKADDLFHIKTKGFRGEALASIAAIASVELSTRQAQSDIGIKIIMEGSLLKKQEAIAGPVGTSIAVKNLFFNIPARRKFLKSDPVELKYIIDEFHRVALAHADIFFSFFHNNNEVFHLPKGPLKQRIVSIFGKSYNEKLYAIDEEGDLMKLSGFIGKAEVAKKSSGEQFFFVNQRFIKSPYLNTAVRFAYDHLIVKEQYPSFFIFIDIDPEKIDINVSPTKTEIKFDEEQLVFNYVRVAVKHALGKYVVMPTLDFSSDTNFISNYSKDKEDALESKLQSRISWKEDSSKLERENLGSWEQIYASSLNKNQAGQDASYPDKSSLWANTTELPLEDIDKPKPNSAKEPYQLHHTYIVSQIKSGFLLIDQQYASERILYESNLIALKGQPKLSQRELFAQHIDFDANKSLIVKELLPYLRKMGFDIEEFGHNSFVIHGTPTELSNSTSTLKLLEQVIHQFSENLELQLGLEENLARSYALSSAIRRGTQLSGAEMSSLIDQLFACDMPYQSPFGHKTFVTYELEEIRRLFLKV